MSVSPNVVILTQDELAARCDVSFQKGVSRGRFEERCDQSRAKATEGKAGMAGVTGPVRRSTAGTGLRVGEASADLPATSEHMDVTAGETAPFPSDLSPDSASAVRGFVDAASWASGSALDDDTVFCEIYTPGYLPQKKGSFGVYVKDLRAVLAATKAEAAPVAVKPLEWEEQHTKRSDEDPSTEITGYEAETSFGTFYTVEVGASLFYVVYDYKGLGEFETEIAAKAAAQADYEQRIRSALIARPPAPVAEVREAIDRIPQHLFWIAGKGRLSKDEPLYGVQIKDPSTSDILAEAEDDELTAAINKACDMLGVPTVNEGSV